MMLKPAYSVCFSILVAGLTPRPWKILHSDNSRVWFYSESHVKLTNCDLQLVCLLPGKCASELFKTVAVFLIHLVWITVILGLDEQKEINVYGVPKYLLSITQRQCHNDIKHFCSLTGIVFTAFWIVNHKNSFLNFYVVRVAASETFDSLERCLINVQKRIDTIPSKVPFQNQLEACLYVCLSFHRISMKDTVRKSLFGLSLTVALPQPE